MQNKTLNDYISDASLSEYTLVPEELVCKAFDVKPRTLAKWRSRGFPNPLRLPGAAKARVYHLGALRKFIVARAEEVERKARARSFTSGR